MRLVKDSISLKVLDKLSKQRFGDLVKAVVDIEKKIMAIDGELHADEEALLIKRGSKQENLWGINLYPEFHEKKDFIVFDSMINVRPSQENMSRGIKDEKIRKKIVDIVNKLIKS